MRNAPEGLLLNTARRAAPFARSRRWLSALAWLVLTGVVVALGVVHEQGTEKRPEIEAPAEGFYWAVAQYQIAHLRLKQQLTETLATGQANNAELMVRAAVLNSKSSILTEPSEFQSLLRAVPGSAQAVVQLSALQVQIDPLLERRPFLPTDALIVLKAMEVADVEGQSTQLANDVRSADLAAKERTLKESAGRKHAVWGALAMCWFAMGMWLAYAIRERRQYAVVAAARQLAVDTLEGALAAKRIFIATVNHEVRSPLQSIVTATEQLAATTLEPKSAAAVQRIQHAVRALRGQLRDLSTIAQTEHRLLTIQEQTFDLGELANDVCEDLREAAECKGLTLTLGVSLSREPLTVVADPIRIGQILRNLVENAIRCTDVGSVAVEVGAISEAPDVSHADETGSILLTIRDTGPGLPASAVCVLQGGAELPDARSAGTGIGLFVVRDLLVQLKGRLEVAAALDGGTLITVNLPVRFVTEPAVDSMQLPALRVLILNASHATSASLCNSARALGHICLAANSTLQAASLLSESQFDVILVDHDLPQGLGVAFAKQLRTAECVNSDAMLILTGTRELRALGNDWPFDGFLAGPVDHEALRQIIGSRTPP